MHKVHTWEAEGETVGRTLNDYLQRSKRADSEGIRQARAVFDQAYAIARQVIELREKHGLTQLELAELSGVPQSQISRIERGVTAPTTTTVARIATALGADLQLVEHERVGA
jgi:DNA-binding XRE family transcriptional regulator